MSLSKTCRTPCFPPPVCLAVFIFGSLSLPLASGQGDIILDPPGPAPTPLPPIILRPVELAERYYVDDDAAGKFADGSRRFPFATIRNALNRAKTTLRRPEIHVAPGEYDEGLLNISFPVSIIVSPQRPN